MTDEKPTVRVRILPGGRFDDGETVHRVGAVIDVHPAIAKMLIEHRGVAELVDPDGFTVEKRREIEQATIAKVERELRDAVIERTGIERMLVESFELGRVEGDGRLALACDEALWYFDRITIDGERIEILCETSPIRCRQYRPDGAILDETLIVPRPEGSADLN